LTGKFENLIKKFIDKKIPCLVSWKDEDNFGYRLEIAMLDLYKDIIEAKYDFPTPYDIQCTMTQLLHALPEGTLHEEEIRIQICKQLEKEHSAVWKWFISEGEKEA